MNMNEQRFVTLILWVMLALGAVGLVAVYFIIGRGDTVEHGARSVKEAVKTGQSASATKVSSLPQIPDVYSTDKSLPEQTLKESGKLSSQSGNAAEKSQEVREETKSADVTQEDSSSSGASLPSDAVDVVAQPQEPLQVTIHETSKDNGTFYSAQEITEGLIIGKRGSAGDRADYYSLKATGKMMILKLAPSPKDEKTRFTMAVFNAQRKPVGKSSGGSDSVLTLPVNPGDTYYIKLNLSRAPIEDSQYQLHLSFENRGR